MTVADLAYHKRRPAQTEHRRQQRLARDAVSRAISRGELIRPDACTACGSSDRFIDAHHFAGWSLDVRLVVQWVCTRCHPLGHPREVAAT
jgi:hypothetical protein